MLLAALVWWLAVAGAAEGGHQCAACSLRSELRSVSLEAIKREILAKLGLERAPNMTGRPVPDIPPLGTIFETQGDQPSPHDDSTATTEKVISFAQPHPRIRHWRRGQDVLYFKFSDKVQDNKVLKAKLWLWLKDSPRHSPGPEEHVTISVHKVSRPSTDDSASLTHVNSIREFVGRGARWIYVDVKLVVSHWFKIPRDNFGLVVRTSGHAAQRVQVVTSHDDPSLIPFVEVNTTEGGKKSRIKRTLGMDCQEDSTETKCCRYPLRVDFEEFGWNWIIAPRMYEAHYCSGECPYVFLQSYPYTHVAQMANNKSVACCAPRKMSSISMLYFDESMSIIYSLLPSMVVDRCGCL